MTDERLAEIRATNGKKAEGHVNSAVQRCREILAEVDRLRAELAEARKDSARMDWMAKTDAWSDAPFGRDSAGHWYWSYLEDAGPIYEAGPHHKTLRAAIDAAMEAR